MKKHPISVTLTSPEFAGNEKGTALKGARLKEGLTQKLVAEETGIPQRHISEMETGNGKCDGNGLNFSPAC